MAWKLSEAAVRNAKPKGKVRKLADGDGLALWVFANESKLWRLSYRLHGKQRVLALGKYPAVGLVEARKKAANAREQLAAGKDPVGEKRTGARLRALAAGATFAIVSEQFLEKLGKEKSEATVHRNRWQLGLVLPHLGARPIGEITAPEILDALRKIATRGRLESAHRTRATIGRVFRFAVACGVASSDPSLSLRGALPAHRKQHYAAIIDPVGLGELLRAIDGYNGRPETQLALELLMLTAVRSGELRGAQWSEFDFGTRTWIIPAARMKMKREHRVPLSQQALERLDRLKAITDRSEFCFPSVRSTKRCISEGTLIAALRRIGYRSDEVTPHGFRSSFSTLANENGRFSSDAIERALAHADKDAVRASYHRGAHWDERIQLMQWWADKLDTLRSGSEAKVIPLKA